MRSEAALLERLSGVFCVQCVSTGPVVVRLAEMAHERERERFNVPLITALVNCEVNRRPARPHWY